MRRMLLVVAMTVGSSSLPAQTQRSVWDGVYTDEQADKGAALYTRSCASCHGADLNGGEMAPSLVGGEFTANWSGLPLTELMTRINTTMPQDAPRSLSRSEDADILSYILKKDGFPAGATALSSESSELSAIQFVATKP